jgi:spoIIIJ-associated protein
MAEVAGAEQSRTESAPARRHPVRERSDSPTQVIATDTVRERAQAIVTELLERMGFHARVTSDVDTAEGEVVVRVSADAEGLLIGRRGQTVDALEHLINRMISTGEATAESRVAVDIGGYRDRRKEALIELAERLKERAVTQGRRIQVSPMSPRDRRILLGVLSHDDTIRTRVLGTGFYRRVALFPAGLEDESATIEVNDEGEDAFAGRRAGDDESA